MADAPQADSIPLVTEDARVFGEEIAQMLEASTFSPEEKVAWASLIPYMGIDEIERLHKVLLRNLEGQVAEDSEDIMLLLKAAKMKHDFAVAHSA